MRLSILSIFFLSLFLPDFAGGAKRAEDLEAELTVLPSPRMSNLRSP